MELELFVPLAMVPNSLLLVPFQHSIFPYPTFLLVSMFHPTQSVNSSNLAGAWEPVELRGVAGRQSQWEPGA